MNVSPAYSVAWPVGMPVTGPSANALDVPVLTGPPDPTATSALPLPVQPEVMVYKNGVVDTSYVGNVTVAIASSDTGTTTIDSGETVVACVAGVGTFTNVILTDPDIAQVVLSFTIDNGQFVLSDPIIVSP